MEEKAQRTLAKIYTKEEFFLITKNSAQDSTWSHQHELHFGWSQDVKVLKSRERLSDCLAWDLFTRCPSGSLTFQKVAIILFTLSKYYILK